MLQAGAQSRDTLSTDVIANGLAQIAMSNDATSKVGEANVKTAEYNYKAQKTAWLDQFRASGNLNEYTLKRTAGVDPAILPGRAFWPRYNFGVGIPFGIFTNQPKQTKAQFYRYQAELESSVAYLLGRQWAIGAEYRMKPDNLGIAKEDDWYDAFVAWAPTKHLSVTLAYADLGNIVIKDRQRGVYASIQLGF